MNAYAIPEIEAPAALDLQSALNALPRPVGVTINRFWIERNEADEAPEHVRYETRVYFTWTDRETMGRPVSERFWAIEATREAADAKILVQVTRFLSL